MAKLVSLSGPQGGGKTTLLNGLAETGIVLDDFKVSRQVQKELGWDSLSNVLESPDTMMTFQAKVRDVKYVRELENLQRTDVDTIITERSFADIATYTQLWTWELVNAEKWDVMDGVEFLLHYVALCKDNQKVYNGNLILPHMDHVKFVADPHRASEAHLDFVKEQLEAFFNLAHPREVPILRITEKSVEDRVEQAYKWIKSL